MLGNYDIKKVTAIVGGLPLTMLAEDSCFELTHEEDDFTLYKGADGSVSRSLNADETILFKCSLAQTSPSNDHLSGLRRMDRAFGMAPFPVMLQDLNGTSIATAPFCFFKKGAGKKYGKNVGNVEWEIYMPNAVEHVGGNFPVGL